MKTRIILAAAIILTGFISCEKDDANNDKEMNDAVYQDVAATKVKTELIDDVSKTPYEEIFDVSPYFEEGHLPFTTEAGSVAALGQMLSGLNKDKSYLVYCHGDGPSIEAAKLMISEGFTKVYRLEGNYGAWDDASFVDISATKAKMKLDNGDFEAIFDVSQYYDNGHIPGATNANTAGGGSNISDLISGLDKNKAYLVYCHGNGPAFAASQLMEDSGFKNVFRLEGNYGAWENAGYPVE